ncbi:GmrSD restriction endonuclease domain-containing protein [Yersinia sp. 2538 StPb PI]|uniref:GmrSD restriction endonuclease domain-containing protein n=1 Tax=Yersinia sp. 2538 StPb PI TaxID=3117405 RepID=UPI003FA4B6E0
MTKDSAVELSIKGESIQSLYSFYLSKTFLVNRRYQRKLVWTIDEKRSFIDSIMKGYPVPLVLLAEKITSNDRQLEIIDGMQRLNAMMSFIDQEFDVNGGYFNLDTMADTKLLKDNGVLVQKDNALDRSICAKIVRYQIPLSVFQQTGNNHVDEVFRRLNSNGRHLSKQELRQAGALSKFASIVRRLSSNIRGDSSASDVLNLNAMKEISITNKSLNYGINVDNIFWVKNSIITKDYLRESKDEEIIADIVAWISIGKGVRSSSDILDQLYGFNDDGTSKESSLAAQVELEIQKNGGEEISSNIQYVLDKLIAVLNKSGKTFNSLLFERQQPKIARYFQIVFLSLYKLIIDEGLEIGDVSALIKKLDKSGDKVINLAAGGGNWSAKEKQTSIDAFCGVIRGCFIKSKDNDPSRNQWITRFENILMQSSTEQTLYDFKVGFHSLSPVGNEFSNALFSKVIKTLTAMANTLPNATGYCIIGVSDSKESADRFEGFYHDKTIEYSNFYINGVDKEAVNYHKDIDTYFTKLTQLIKNEPISERDKDNISRNLLTIKYFDKTVIIMKIESGDVPSIYGDKYYVRHGSNIEEVLPANFATLFSRFHK